MAVSESDLKVDRAVAQICGLAPLLSHVTPTNVSAARRRFLSDRKPPDFEYRELPDIDEIEERLSEIQTEDVNDPTIALLVEGMMKDLRLRLEMFAARGTERFFLTSVEMFGHVDQPTLELAHRILEEVEVSGERKQTVDAHEFAKAARREMAWYRSQYPEMTATVTVSDTVSGVLVETGDLYVGEQVQIAEDRVESLLQHEVGTHVVTYENGRAQPLQMLGLGLAGYDELQEALGVLAEYLAGNLPPSRLRVLAYRVIAAQLRSDGADFTECVDRLEDLGASPAAAFNTTMRAYRSGGMTKDAIYLRGLTRLLDHLASGGEFENLFVGKISFETIPLVRDLSEREVLAPPPLRPRFLEMEGSLDRLERLRSGATPEVLGGIAA